MNRGFIFWEIEPGHSYKIEFVGGNIKIVKVTDFINDSYGKTMYLLGDDDSVYNFSNVISFKKAQVIENG